jgi:hypothetical protein
LFRDEIRRLIHTGACLVPKLLCYLTRVI